MTPQQVREVQATVLHRGRFEMMHGRDNIASTPEPASFWVMAALFAGLAAWKLRRIA